MFEKGEYIIYGTSGVCKIEDITTMNMASVPKDKLFYVLSPSSQKGGRIFTPVDNSKAVMRRVLSKEEAAQLIDEIPVIEELWITNEKMREEKYKECMRSGDCRNWRFRLRFRRHRWKPILHGRLNRYKRIIEKPLHE